MGTITVSRKQRLRTLENDIRKAAGEIQNNGLQIGRDLCEIRDEELWAEEYPSWNQYLKERAHELVGKSFARATSLIQASEVEKRIPSGISPDVKTNLSASHLSEIGRLAPVVGKDGERGAEKDYSNLRKQDVSRVLKKATEIAGGKEPSVRDVRKAVDHDLGIDRSAKAKETKQANVAGIKPEDYLRAKIGLIEGITENLAEVPADAWTQLEKADPGLAERLAQACDTLAELLRS